ncbi:MAG TPA: CiaB protein [Sulfurospirillum sp. UBA12182]|nr:MAG TPA: CiaB protein [Sulfurospirillum sp. UBA12182]
MRKKFENDLKKLYEFIGQRQVELGKYYEVVEDSNSLMEISFIDEIMQEIGLKFSNQNRLAMISRLVSLRDEQMVQALEAEGFTQEEITYKKRVAYFWTRNFHLKRHEELLEKIELEEWLNPFYRRLLRGVHEIGIVLSNWQDDWMEHIINTINPLLSKRYGESVMEYLRKNDLIQKDENGLLSDRTYSVLVEKEEGFEAKAYADFFQEDVKEVVARFQILITDLQKLPEDDTNQKEVYINYLVALKEAFSELELHKLITRWQEVDRAWMKVTSPLQIGHPLEYYEDHYRKAVALEWDVRISNPKNLGAQKTYENILYMYSILFEKLGEQKQKIFALTKSNLQRVQLYIGRPALYYGAEFNGLFSAQVVPNDELVSEQEGKKIFAFADNILDSIKAKPFLKIQRIIFGEEFLNKERELVFKKPELWHRVYEATTIGHEYGHILWLDSDSETLMNQSGIFKNIEEFKATTGGLMAFFYNEDEEIKEYILNDVIKRAVGLIAWMKTDEVQPYYCEGLIHLEGLFASGVLSFDGSLHVKSNYEALKQWYFETYEALAKHYLEKKDAKEFLSRYALKQEGVYQPVTKEVRDFVAYYWQLHKDIGRDIDELSSKSQWI